MARKSEGSYVVTAFGIISGIVDEETASRIYDALELYALRHGHNAILFKDGGTYVKIRFKKARNCSKK